MTSPSILGLGKWLQLSLVLCAISVSSSNDLSSSDTEPVGVLVKRFGFVLHEVSDDDESTGSDTPVCGTLVQTMECKDQPSEDSHSETVPNGGVPVQIPTMGETDCPEKGFEERISKQGRKSKSARGAKHEGYQYRHWLARDDKVRHPKDTKLFPPNIRFNCWEEFDDGIEMMLDQKIHCMRVTRVLGFYRKPFSYWPQDQKCCLKCPVSCFTSTIGVTAMHWGIYAKCIQGGKTYYFRVQVQSNQVTVESVFVPIGKKPNRISQGIFYPELMLKHPYTQDVSGKNVTLGSWLNNNLLKRKDGLVKQWEHGFWKSLCQMMTPCPKSVSSKCNGCFEETYMCQDFVIDSWKIMGLDFGTEFERQATKEQRQEIEHGMLASQWCVDIPILRSDKELAVYANILTNSRGNPQLLENVKQLINERELRRTKT